MTKRGTSEVLGIFSLYIKILITKIEFSFIYIEPMIQRRQKNPNNQITPCEQVLWGQWEEKKLPFNRKKTLAEQGSESGGHLP